MRAVESAIWTSGEPVSLSARLCSAISLPLTSFSTAKLGLEVYVGLPDLRPAAQAACFRAPPAVRGQAFFTVSTLPSERGSAPARHRPGPSTTIACACPSWLYFAGTRRTVLSARDISAAPG